MRTVFPLNPRKVTWWFAGATVSLLALHLIFKVLRTITDADLSGLVHMFHVGREQNLPTFYSIVALLFCAGLTGMIGLDARRCGRGLHRCWLLLSFGFAFMAFDEFAGLHELLIDPVRNLLGTSGMLHFAWVIPYSALVLALVPIFCRFLLNLPRRTALLFATAGTVFILGAVFFELLSGWLLSVQQERNFWNFVLPTMEEGFEMIGVVIFIFAVTDYASRTGLHVYALLGSPETNESSLPGNHRQPFDSSRPDRSAEDERNSVRPTSTASDVIPV